MQEMQLFEYAVVRLVPKVEREEFLNVGVVLFSKKAGYLQFAYHLNHARITAFDATIEIAAIKAYLEAFEQICTGCAASTPIARLDASARFRWLTAARSTIIQTSKVHVGFSQNLPQTLQQLLQQQVLAS